MKMLSIGHLTYDINLIMNEFPKEGSNSLVKEMKTCCGGAASTVSIALGKWNAESYVSGIIGYDEMGTMIKKTLEENKVFTPYLETNYEMKTTASYVLINTQNNSRTIIKSPLVSANLKKYEYDQMMDCIIVDGYEYNASIFAFNKFNQAISILNAKTPRQGLLDYFKYVKYAICTDEVAQNMTGMKIDFSNPITMSTIYKRITEKYPHVNLMITIPNKGTIYSVNNEIKVLASIQTEVVDQTGARDVFVAMIGYGLTSGYNLETTIRLATIAESKAKKAIGATLAVPTLSDVVQFYEEKFGSLTKMSTDSHEIETI